MSATTSTSPVQPSVGPVAPAAKTSSAAAPPVAAAPPAARPTSPSRRAGTGVNWRVVIVLSVVAIPFLWIGYMLVSQLVTGGVSRHGDYYAVDLKALGNFSFDQTAGTVADVPERYRQLDGKKVHFEGEMYAPNEASPYVHDFQLVYSIVACCMGGPPKVQERVFAYVPEHKKIHNYSGQQVTCTGTLHIKIVRDASGEAVSVFTMEVDDVQPRT